MNACWRGCRSSHAGLSFPGTAIALASTHKAGVQGTQSSYWPRPFTVLHWHPLIKQGCRGPSPLPEREVSSPHSLLSERAAGPPEEVCVDLNIPPLTSVDF